MNSRQRKTFAAVFSDPVRSDVEWKSVESLFISLGAEISEGSGSRARFTLNEVRGSFHRPHPERATDKGALKAVRDFLTNAGFGTEAAGEK